MFNTFAHTAIDTIQTGKKYAVTTTVKYEPLADIIIKFVDVQTQYTKNFIDSLITTGTSLVELSMTKDLGTQIVESYAKPTEKSVSKKAK